MDCADARALADPLNAGELDAFTNQTLRRHLERCQACRHEIDMQRRLRLAVKNAFERDESLSVRPPFVAKLTADLRRARPVHRRSPRRWPALIMLATAAVCVLIAYAGRERLESGRFEALVRTAAGDHENCVVQFRLDERPVAMPEAGRRFGAMYAALSTLAPRPTAQDEIEVLSRHACLYHGRRFAHIVVRYKGVEGSLLVTSAPGLDARQPVMSHAGDLNLLSYVLSDHVIVVVCPLDAAETRELAEAFEAPIAQALAGF